LSLRLVLGLLGRLGCLTLADQSIVHTSMIGHLPHNGSSEPVNEIVAWKIFSYAASPKEG
jgi:hypothetical protein